MTKNSLAVGLALAVLGVCGSSMNRLRAAGAYREALTAQTTGDACALLQASEIQVLAGNGKVGAGRPSTDPLGSRICRYEWGTGNNVPSGPSILDVTVTPASKAFPGMNASLVRQGLLASAKAGDPNAAVIAAVGDAAIYQSDAQIQAKTTALVKGNVLTVTFESADARAKKDHLIALLKAPAGRL